MLYPIWVVSKEELLLAAELRGRRPRRGGELVRVAVRAAEIDPLERLLLRRGVGALEADRDRCADCGRTPLTGEHVHLYEGRRGGLVCELCRALRRRAPAATELVRHCEHGHTVRLTRVAQARAR
jgi:hypothetical protein